MKKRLLFLLILCTIVICGIIISINIYGYLKYKEVIAQIKVDASVPAKLTLQQWYTLKLATDKLQGFVLKRNKIFSFKKDCMNKIKRYKYHQANFLIKDGEVIYTTGGAISLLATVLYNLALHSGLEIIEHYHHKRIIDILSSVPIGLEVYVGKGCDLKFKNTLGGDIKFKLYLSEEELIGRFYSNKKYFDVRIIHQQEIEDGLIACRVFRIISHNGKLKKKEKITDIKLPLEEVIEEF